MWIAIEGVDAVGKSTQVSRVAAKLRESTGRAVVEIPEFSDSPVGTAIVSIIAQQRFFSLDNNKMTPLADILTTLSDLTYLYEKHIVPAVENGGIAISDRSPASPLGYQLTSGDERMQSKSQKLFEVVAGFIGACNVVPDLCILLSLPDTEIAKRVVARGELQPTSEEITYLQMVKKQLERAATMTCREIVEVNGNQAIQTITDNIVEICLDRINKR